MHLFIQEYECLVLVNKGKLKNYGGTLQLAPYPGEAVNILFPSCCETGMSSSSVSKFSSPETPSLLTISVGVGIIAGLLTLCIFYLGLFILGKAQFNFNINFLTGKWKMSH